MVLLFCADMKANDASSLSPDTVYSYIVALKEIFVVEDVPSWNPNLRSKTAIRSSDTRYFVDPSIATASLGIGPGDLIEIVREYSRLQAGDESTTSYPFLVFQQWKRKWFLRFR